MSRVDAPIIPKSATDAVNAAVEDVLAYAPNEVIRLGALAGMISFWVMRMARDYGADTTRTFLTGIAEQTR